MSDDKDEEREELDYRGFTDAILRVCEQFGISIGHEDSQGGFLLRPYNSHDARWFDAAQVDED